MSRDILIKNAQTVLTMDDMRRELHVMDIHLSAGQIKAIGADLSVHNGAHILDASMCIVTPGLVNTRLRVLCPVVRMRFYSVGCKRSIRFGQSSRQSICAFLRWLGWLNWRYQVVR